MGAREHAVQQRHAVAHGEERHVERHVLHPVEEEDDAHEEEQMVVAGHHVLGAEIQERHQAALFHEGAIGGRDAVRDGRRDVER